jgi:FKBP-type peptidyl-prolyl cis-trans isomerase SlyD
MRIESNKVVSVTYNLEVNDGGDTPKVFVEKTGTDRPLVFLYGTGNMIVGFERALNGLQAGDLFDFSISPEDGYGESQEDDIVELPYSIFAEAVGKQPDLLSIGNIIPMNDGQGHQFEGRVKMVGLDTVTMDFNHPLAGKTLHFTGRIESLRDASPDEISHGHVHGDGGVHH